MSSQKNNCMVSMYITTVSKLKSTKINFRCKLKFLNLISALKTDLCSCLLESCYICANFHAYRMQITSYILETVCTVFSHFRVWRFNYQHGLIFFAIFVFDYSIRVFECRSDYNGYKYTKKLGIFN